MRVAPQEVILGWVAQNRTKWKDWCLGITRCYTVRTSITQDYNCHRPKLRTKTKGCQKMPKQSNLKRSQCNPVGISLFLLFFHFSIYRSNFSIYTLFFPIFPNFSIIPFFFILYVIFQRKSLIFNFFWFLLILL